MLRKYFGVCNRGSGERFPAVAMKESDPEATASLDGDWGKIRRGIARGRWSKRRPPHPTISANPASLCQEFTLVLGDTLAFPLLVRFSVLGKEAHHLFPTSLSHLVRVSSFILFLNWKPAQSERVCAYALHSRVMIHGVSALFARNKTKRKTITGCKKSLVRNWMYRHHSYDSHHWHECCIESYCKLWVVLTGASSLTLPRDLVSHPASTATNSFFLK